MAKLDESDFLRLRLILGGEEQLLNRAIIFHHFLKVAFYFKVKLGARVHTRRLKLLRLLRRVECFV